MAIRWKIQEVARARGILSAPSLAEHAEIAPGTATSLWYGRPSRIDFGTLSRLCRVFNCQIFDLVEYVPGDDNAVIGSTPIREEESLALVAA